MSEVKRSLTPLCVVLLCTALAGNSRASAARSLREPQLTTYAGVAISPDGRYVADVESPVPANESIEPTARLYVRTIATGAAREIPLSCSGVPGCSVTVPRWSHDSKTIAYAVHASKSPKRRIALATVTDASIVARTLLIFSGSFRELSFSADDTKLAGLAVAGAHKEVGATQAGTAIVGEIGAAPDEQRIAIVSLDRPSVTYASPPDLFVYEYDWLPDGRGFVGTAAPGDGDNNWWIAKMMRFDATTALASVLYAPKDAQEQLASPRVSPDGKSVAFIGGIMSDFGSTGGVLRVIDGATPPSKEIGLVRAEGTEAASVTSVTWKCDGDGLIFTQLHGANADVFSGSVKSFGDRTKPISSAPESLSGDDVAEVSRACETRSGDTRSFAIAAIRQTFEHPPEIVTAVVHDDGPIVWSQLTHANDALASETVAKSVTWTNEGFSVQGWLLQPARADTTTKHPMIVSVHGGPAAAVTPRFVGRGATRDFLRTGYSVFLPNPRGSFGQGERFTKANVRDFGYGDLRDILTGVDAVEKADPTLDDARLGITGGSYGGFMTMWAVTQTQRFKAAVAGAGIANWISYYGENGIDEWMIPYFGASAYDDPAVYRRSSPIDFITHVKTPTFAFVGERDVECPAPQSQEFWHAVLAQHVPTSLVIYAGEGHRIRAPKNTADIRKRTLAWFARYFR